MPKKKKKKGYKELSNIEQGKLHSLKGKLTGRDLKKRIAEVNAKVALEKLKRKKARQRKKK